MKKILFLLLLAFFIPLNVFAQEKKTAVLFYADWCFHCQKVETYFQQQGFFEKYDIQKMNFDNQQNKKILGKIFIEQGKGDKSGIPALIIDEQLIIGDQTIIAQFENSIENSQGTAQKFVASFSDAENIEDVSDKNDVTLPTLFLAALADAINPCEMAVLLLLLATIISAKGKKQALFAGLMFSLAIFISYLSMGLGLYQVISFLNIGKYLSLIIGILAIMIALANFKDVFWYGKFFVMEVPMAWRPKMQQIIRGATNPWSAFLIGFAVSLFLVPCTSGPYVIILGKLAEGADFARTVSLLVLYNLIFIFPMIVITFGMYFFDIKMKKLEAIRKNNLRLLHAITGIIMLVLGAYLIYARG